MARHRTFTKVLVGVDRHAGGNDALVLADKLVAEGGKLILTHVYTGDARVWNASPAEHERIEEERARDLLAQVCCDAGVGAELRTAQAPSAGRGLHEVAESCGADLLVVGSSHRGKLGRVLLGDDTWDALNGAPCAVAIAPAGYAHGPAVEMREIGVAYNGSAESEHAVSVAVALAAEHGARLSACQAITLPAQAFIAGAAPVDGVIEDSVVAARERMGRLGAAEPHVVYGSVVEELTRYSASVDLLVIGSRGYGPIGRLVHGSTSGQLAHAAHCPLLVLTRTAPASAENHTREGGRLRKDSVAMADAAR